MLRVLLPQRHQLLVLAAVLFVVLPLLVFLVVPDDAALVLLRRLELPAIEERLGFAAAYVRLPESSGVRRPVFAITSVTPGGPFAIAGVHIGDVRTGYHHGAERGFIWDLVWAQREATLTLRFVPAEAVALGQWEQQRTVTVRIPHSHVKPAT